MEDAHKLRLYFLVLFRALLLFAGVSAAYRADWFNIVLSLFVLFATFLPRIIVREWKLSSPSLFEILILVFIYLSVFPEIMGHMFENYWWWDIFLNSQSTLVIGAICFSLVYFLFWERRELGGLTPLLVSLFSFCLSFTIVTVTKISFFVLVFVLGFKLQRQEMIATAPYLVSNMFLDLGITFLVALIGFVYVRYYKGTKLDRLAFKLFKQNPRLFKRHSGGMDSTNELQRLIDAGEGAKLEFKSTLRVNLHTLKPDRRIEHAVSKTIAAYMNTDGGCLLIGVSDEGTITGIGADGFQSNDKFNQHFSNIFGRSIGNEFLPYIGTELMDVGGKFVLRVDCVPSDKPVFLKEDGKEEFYIRSSASTIEITGHKLIEYINRRFR